MTIKTYKQEQDGEWKYFMGIEDAVEEKMLYTVTEVDDSNGEPVCNGDLIRYNGRIYLVQQCADDVLGYHMPSAYHVPSTDYICLKSLEREKATFTICYPLLSPKTFL